MGLGLNLKKEGYEYSSNTNSFTYSAVYLQYLSFLTVQGKTARSVVLAIFERHGSFVNKIEA
jgi:hypothetical protein